MRDIENPKWIYIKGFLFLILGSTASAVLCLRTPEFTTIFLLCVAIWSFCRFYYFAFYALHHYVDESFRYSGILSLLRHILGKARDKELPS